AENDNAVFTPASGYIFRGTVGTAAPTPAELAAWKPGDTLAGWESVGHTQRDELPEFGNEGGDSETKGTWQNASFKQVTTETPVDYVTFNVHQFDSSNLELYYGAPNASTTSGVFAVSEAPTSSVEVALLVIIRDGSTNLGFWAPGVSGKREGAIELAVEDVGVMPLRATVLKLTNPAPMDLFQWINEDLFPVEEEEV